MKRNVLLLTVVVATLGFAPAVFGGEDTRPAPPPSSKELGSVPGLATQGTTTTPVVPMSTPAVVAPATTYPTTTYPGTVTYPDTFPSGTTSPGTVVPAGNLPDGWQHHRPGQVVWSSEWGTTSSGGTAPGVVAHPGVVSPDGTSFPAPAEGFFDGDVGMPADGMPVDGADMGGAMADRRRFLTQQYMEKARAALLNADSATARDWVSKALDLDPTNREARDLMREISMDRASTSGAYLDEQADTKVVSREKAALEVRNYLQRGQSLAAREDYAGAVREYKKALAIVSWYDETADFGTDAGRIRDLIDNTEYQARVAARRARQEQIAEAVRHREEEMRGAREQRMGRIRAWFEGAHRAFRRAEYSVAREYAKQILRADPVNRDAQELIELSHDAEHMDNQVEARRMFDRMWKSIMQDLEEAALPQVDTVVFPENWLDDIAQRKPRIVGDEIDLTESADVVAIQSILDKKRVQGLTWEEANLDTAVSYLQTITGLNFYVTPKVRAEKIEDVAINLTVDDVSVSTVLDLITEPNELRWAPKGGVVYVMMAEELAGDMKLRFFDIKDLQVQIQNFLGAEINLVPSNFTPPEAPELPEPEPIINADNLVELIQNTIGGEAAWENGTIQAQNGILIVRNTQEILGQIDDLLSQLRANSGLLVNLEVRFLTAEDNFLKDVGVDLRGLGNGNNPVAINGQGPLVVQDDVFFGSNANPPGGTVGTNNEPSSVGTSNDAGIFYNDGQDGAYAARVENLFDTTVRTFGNPEVLTASGGLSFQSTFLDDTAIEVILRAVEKSERVQQITAPRITVYNTQRANVSVVNQISYVQDYEVEIAQASNIANPVIQTIQEGVVLDVRPIVSADRRFVTLELRPTVAVVQRPIAEFVTNLASGPVGLGVSSNAPVTIQIPELRVSRVRTTVSMPDGGTLLVGGLKFYDKDVRESGIPIFSKVPILSFLLSRKGRFVNRRNLLVLVTARIVPLEELEPRDDLSLPPEPVRQWTPTRVLEPCGEAAEGDCGCSVPAPQPCAPQPCQDACQPCNACGVPGGPRRDVRSGTNPFMPSRSDPILPLKKNLFGQPAACANGACALPGR